MKNVTVAILFSTLFGAIGGVAGYYIGKTKYLKVADKEIESMKIAQKSHDEFLKSTYGIKTTSKDLPKQEIPQPAPEQKQNTKTHVDYAKLYAPDQNSPKRDPGVYLISDQEFDESENSYQSLLFYAGDNTIADTDDNCIPNYAKLIGSIDTWMHELLSNGRAIYIRNDATGIDYEVVCKEDKWSNVASPSQKAAVFAEVGDNTDDESD